MRADARTLLDRLGRSDFAYKEFADRFSDLELWPLFEALLKDPRLFHQELATAVEPVSRNESVKAPGIAAARLADPAPNASAREALGALFDRYAADPGGGAPASQRQDVRAILRRLSELDARGEL